MDMRHDEIDDLLGTPANEKSRAAGPRNGSGFNQESFPAEQNTAQSPITQEPDDFDDLLGNPVFNADARVWTAWREETRNGSKTKVPYQSVTEKSASSNPATWITRADARSVAAHLKTDGRKGVGIFLGGYGRDLLRRR